ncbi:Ribosome production factor 2-like protein [Hypsibius exemplaris]|uniref:Ribosome production factor 2 homolog n=1 Tax=Hypsibius exemplaris TaxID=2072580 RepID=A0A1W0WLX9_HYPEX|nr:Ribosome production factor 2-like protein [Hypsibius exemplaris]
MSLQHKVIKPKSQKGKRFIKNREPKIFENTKNALALRTNTANETVVRILKDLCALKKPESAFMGRKHELRPFEDEQALEKFSTKYDSSLILTGSHNKKRPSCITFARTYDGSILDMFEFCVENFKGISDFQGLSPPLGNKPLLIFRGESFEHDPIMGKIKTMFIDYFRGPTVDKIRPAGVQHCITFTSIGSTKILMRTFMINGITDGTEGTVTKAALTPMGPSMDLIPKRSKLASNDVWKVACRVPKEATIKKKKNISQDAFGSKLGRIHMDTQDFSKLATRKMKGLKKDRKEDADESAEEEEDDDSGDDVMDTLEEANPVGEAYDDIGGDLD